MARSVRALANPIILRWAREDRGISLETAASRIGVKTNKLFACENGGGNLTFAQLRKAAETYRRPTSTFYLAKTPPALKIPTFRRKATDEDEPLSPELRLEIRKFHYKRENAIELSDFGKQFDWDYVGSITIDDDPEMCGAKIRSMLRIPDSFPTGFDKYQSFGHWRNAIERIGILVFQISNVLVEEMRGLSVAEPPYPFIAVNRKDDPKPRSFSLIHELCHILLDDSSICDIHEEFSIDGRKFTNHETFCNHAAGAVLVPSNLLLSDPTVVGHGTAAEWSNQELARLSGRFRVSKEVILRRLLIMKRTTDGFYGAVRNRLTYPKAPKRKAGGGEYAHERVLRTDGRTYTSMVIDALDSNAISYADASDFLGIRISDLEPLRDLLSKKGR